MKKLITFLQSTPQLSVEKAAEIADCFSPLDIPRNDYLLRAGAVSDAWYFIESGFMRAFAQDTDGNEVTTGFYAAGQPVFEAASFFQRTRSQESLQALTDCTGWYLTFAQLNELFHAMPEFREMGRGILVKGYSDLKQRMLSAITTTAEARYATLLEMRPEVLQHAPLKMIASYLGVTDTSLSRIRAAYQRK